MCGVWSVGGFSLKILGFQICWVIVSICSLWDHPTPSEDTWSLSPKPGAKAKQCLRLQSEYHRLTSCSVHRKVEILVLLIRHCICRKYYISWSMWPGIPCTAKWNDPTFCGTNSLFNDLNRNYMSGYSYASELSTIVGSIPTLVRVFLCPCLGPVPSVGLTLTWFIWDRNLALHVTLHSFQLTLFKI